VDCKILRTAVDSTEERCWTSSRNQLPTMGQEATLLPSTEYQKKYDPDNRSVSVGKKMTHRHYVVTLLGGAMPQVAGRFNIAE